MTAAVTSNIAAVLSDIQWDEGFSIPVANADNKALESEIQQKQKEVRGEPEGVLVGMVSRRKYWATRSSVRSFARTAHSFARSLVGK